jgi:hypothetical protein
MQAFILYFIPEKTCWKTLIKCHFSSRVRFCDVQKLFIPRYVWCLDHEKGTQGKIRRIWWMFQESCLYLGHRHLCIEYYVERSALRPQFHTIPVHLVFVVDGVVLDLVLSQSSCFPLLVSFNQCSIHMHLPSADAVWSEQLTVSLINTRKNGMGMISLWCQMCCYSAVLFSKRFKSSRSARLFGRNKVVADTSFVIKESKSLTLNFVDIHSIFIEGVYWTYY